MPSEPEWATWKALVAVGVVLASFCYERGTGVKVRIHQMNTYF